MSLDLWVVSNKDELNLVFDDEIAAYRLVGSNPGPAGAAVIELAGGVRLSVDGVEPDRIVEIVVDLPGADSSAEPEPEAMAALSRLVGVDASMLALARNSDQIVRLEPETAETRSLSARLALLDAVRHHDPAHPTSPLWDSEAAVLAHRLDTLEPLLGLGSRASAQAEVGAAALLSLAPQALPGVAERIREAIEVAAKLVRDPDLRTEIALLLPSPLATEQADAGSSQAAGQVPPTKGAFEVPGLTRVRDAMSGLKARFGGAFALPIPAAGTLADPEDPVVCRETYLLDVELVAQGAFRPGWSIAVAYDHRDNTLESRVGVIPGAVAPLVEQHWFRVIDRSGSPIALSRLNLDAEAQPEMAMATLLVPHDLGALVDVWVEVTRRPGETPKSPRVRRLREAQELALEAARAQRHTDHSSAAKLWRRSAAAWKRLGDGDRQRLAMNSAVNCQRLASGDADADRLGESAKAIITNWVTDERLADPTQPQEPFLAEAVDDDDAAH